MYPFAPAASAASRSVRRVFAVSMYSGTEAVDGSAFSIRHTVSPSIPGRTTSSSTRSKRDSFARRRPSGPVPAVSTSTGPSSSMLRTSSRITGSSSTTRIRNGERGSTRGEGRGLARPSTPATGPACSAQRRHPRRVGPPLQAVGQAHTDEVARAVEHPELHAGVELERDLAPRLGHLVHRKRARQHHPFLAVSYTHLRAHE